MNKEVKQRQAAQKFGKVTQQKLGYLHSGITSDAVGGFAEECFMRGSEWMKGQKLSDKLSDKDEAMLRHYYSVLAECRNEYLSEGSSQIADVCLMQMRVFVGLFGTKLFKDCGTEKL